MAQSSSSNDTIRSTLDIPYPDFSTLPADVQAKFDSLGTKVNFFRMLGYSAGAYVPMIDLTNAIFRDLTISDYHKELLVLLVAAHEGVTYEWEQHVSIAQVAGVRPDQFIAIAEERTADAAAFTESEQVLLRFGKAILDKGKASGVLVKHALRHFSTEELSDAIIVLGYYRMVSGYIQTFDIEVDAQEDGSWIKG